MSENKNWIEQQVMNRTKYYNQQRIGIAISICIFMAFLFLTPVMGDESFYIRLSVLCSALLMFCSVVFVLSFRSTLLLFLVMTNIMAILLVLKEIHFELYLILILINAGTFLISKKISSAFIQSVTDEIEIINSLRIEATTDRLTQLLNRNGLEQAIETAWAFCKRNKKRVGFLMIDIDYFKSYNDALGHLEGDNILKQVANSIKECFKRETDIISRFGGEEFLIFLSDIDDVHIVDIAQLLSSTITNLKIKSTAANNPNEFLSVSIGIVTSMPQAHDQITDLYKQVDKAVYHAKRNGRNCISFNGNIIKNNPKNSQISIMDSVRATGVLMTGFACEDKG